MGGLFVLARGVRQASRSRDWRTPLVRSAVTVSVTSQSVVTSRSVVSRGRVSLAVRGRDVRDRVSLESQPGGVVVS